MSTAIDSIFAARPRAGRAELIPILQEVQELEGCLTEGSICRIARELDLPASKVYGVATFYNQFRFHAPGQYHVQVCRGTACHVKGSALLLEAVERELGVKAGKTTRDGLFSLEVVACIGACGLAPVIAVNGEFHGGVEAEDVKGILGAYRGGHDGDRGKEGSDA